LIARGTLQHHEKKKGDSCRIEKSKEEEEKLKKQKRWEKPFSGPRENQLRASSLAFLCQTEKRI
jgi:hypothetical protein